MAGIAGSGKSFSSLKMARGLTDSWEKIAVIDTENSIDKYADRSDLGPFQVINLAEEKDDNRYSPASFCRAIDVCIQAGMEVIILDSATHVWHWCLENKGNGDEFRAWNKVTPLYNKFVRKIAEAPVHIICCMRRKSEYVYQDGGKNRKGKFEKAGLKAEMREGFEYEMDVAFTLDHQHLASVEKDRTSLFIDKPDFIINEKVGHELRKWCDVESKFDTSDENLVAAIRAKIKSAGIGSEEGDEFIEKLHGVPTTEARKMLAQFLSEGKSEPKRQPHTFYKDDNSALQSLWRKLDAMGIHKSHWDNIVNALDGTSNSEFGERLKVLVDGIEEEKSAAAAS